MISCLCDSVKDSYYNNQYASKYGETVVGLLSSLNPFLTRDVIVIISMHLHQESEINREMSRIVFVEGSSINFKSPINRTFAQYFMQTFTRLYVSFAMDKINPFDRMLAAAHGLPRLTSIEFGGSGALDRIQEIGQQRQQGLFCRALIVDHPGVNDLSFSLCGIHSDHADIGTPTSLLREIARIRPNLHGLSVRRLVRDYRETGVDNLTVTITTFCNIRRLHLDAGNLSSRELKMICQRCTLIEDLSLCYPHNRLSGRTVFTSIRNLRYLHTLDISGCALATNDFACFAELEGSALRTLVMKQCFNFWENTHWDVVIALFGRLNSLRNLDLQYSYISVVALAQFGILRNLERLVCGGYCGVDNRDFERLLEAQRYQRVIEVSRQANPGLVIEFHPNHWSRGSSPEVEVELDVERGYDP